MTRRPLVPGDVVPDAADSFYPGNRVGSGYTHTEPLRWQRLWTLPRQEGSEFMAAITGFTLDFRCPCPPHLLRVGLAHGEQPGIFMMEMYVPIRKAWAPWGTSPAGETLYHPAWLFQEPLVSHPHSRRVVEVLTAAKVEQEEEVLLCPQGWVVELSGRSVLDGGPRHDA